MSKRKTYPLWLVGINLRVERPGVTRARLESFITDALESWGGQFHPDDPLFNSTRIETIVSKKVGRVLMKEDEK